MIHCNPFYIQLLFDTVLKDMDSYDLLKLLVTPILLLYVAYRCFNLTTNLHSIMC